MYTQAHINKFKYYVLIALGLYTLLIVFLTNNLHGKNVGAENFHPTKTPVLIYELMIDFGNDAVFLHEVTKYKWYCEERVKYITRKDNVKAYCVKREL